MSPPEARSTEPHDVFYASNRCGAHKTVHWCIQRLQFNLIVHPYLSVLSLVHTMARLALALLAAAVLCAGVTADAEPAGRKVSLKC
jgi:hypothetical protein